MSTHEVRVVQLTERADHPNADQLEIWQAMGWDVVARKGEYKVGDYAIFVEPDYEVPTGREEFAFLADKANAEGWYRVRPVKLRGVVSHGLLIPLKGDFAPGTTPMERLGIRRYEPVVAAVTGAEAGPGPKGVGDVPKFDVESWEKYRDRFTALEEVVITEKLHGANARFVWAANNAGEYGLFVGSRTEWKRPGEHIWSRALKQCPGIEEWCKAFGGRVLYGEVYGQVQDLKYGHGKNSVSFAAFAAWEKGKWVDYTEWTSTCDAYGIPRVPELYRGPYHEPIIRPLSEGDSRVPGAHHLMEGLVIQPLKERTDPLLGRVITKCVSAKYLSRDTDKRKRAEPDEASVESEVPQCGDV